MLKPSLIALGLILLPVAPALADRYHGDYHPRHNHYKPRTVVSFNFGGPAYHPRRHYYQPVPVYYAPPVYYQQQQPQVIYISDNNSRAARNSDDRYCREYQAVSRIGGSKQQTYGTACLQPDGSWEIIS